jgi:hypothetical protein
VEGQEEKRSGKKGREEECNGGVEVGRNGLV